MIRLNAILFFPIAIITYIDPYKFNSLKKNLKRFMIRRTTPNKQFRQQKSQSLCCGWLEREEKGEASFSSEVKAPSREKWIWGRSDTITTKNHK